MKWKRILIAIAIALLAVTGLQCFWLFRQFSTQPSATMGSCWSVDGGSTISR